MLLAAELHASGKSERYRTYCLCCLHLRSASGGAAKLRKVEETLCVEDLVGYKFHRGWRSVDGGTAGHLPDSGLLEVEYAVGQHVHDGQQAQRILHAPCHAERLEAVIRACLALYCQEE